MKKITLAKLFFIAYLANVQKNCFYTIQYGLHGEIIFYTL